MSYSIPKPTAPPEARVFDHVPMAHVASVDSSIDFYAKLGLLCESRFTDDQQQAYYAAVCADAAELMLVRADGPVIASQQAVLFYMYTSDVAALRKHLLNCGLKDGGVYAARPAAGQQTEVGETSVVYSVTHPFYMNEGEIRIHDPDGYVVLVGQFPSRKPHKRKLQEFGLMQVTMTVSSVATTLPFYRDVLGLTFVAQAGDNIAFLTDGSVRLMLTTPQGAGEVGVNSILYFRVHNVEQRLTEMVGKGAKKERDAQLAAKMPDHDLWIAFVRDPDDNLIGLMEEKRS